MRLACDCASTPDSLFRVPAYQRASMGKARDAERKKQRSGVKEIVHGSGGGRIDRWCGCIAIRSFLTRTYSRQAAWGPGCRLAEYDCHIS